jgi:hypothetical protein
LRLWGPSFRQSMVIDCIDQRYGAGDKVPAGAVTAAE